MSETTIPRCLNNGEHELQEADIIECWRDGTDLVIKECVRCDYYEEDLAPCTHIEGYREDNIFPLII